MSANRDWNGWADATSALTRQWTIPDRAYDLVDSDTVLFDVEGFTITNGFRNFLICLALPENRNQPTPEEWLLRLRSDQIEYNTAEEAEAGLIVWLTEGGYDKNQPWAKPDGFDPDPPAGMPLSGLILRNNGTIGGDRNFLPIDRINRGRSYLFMDVRPRWLSA